ncbi:hypothetical protein D9C73_028321 [Collichthys lucidus]|uniref:Uncharacterized protein n=1 Tax=Collichthys lucidus TaxID=240159 RepID=A0A4U5TVA2_COLLU|nr:hypothetical protein D9C73_028321 [Collichthys lucidus]
MAKQGGTGAVGFGDFKFETLQSLYESEDSKKIRFVNYLRRKAPAPGTQMENAVRYIKSRDRPESCCCFRHQHHHTAVAPPRCTPPAAAAAATAAAAQPAKAAEKPKTALHLRPLSLDGVLCLRWKCRPKVKRLVTPKPAFPALDVQAHLSLCPIHLRPPPLPPLTPASDAAALTPPPPSVSPLMRSEEATQGQDDPPALQVQVQVQGTPPPQPAIRRRCQHLPPPSPPLLAVRRLLPESWRAALTAGQQDWIGRVLFTRDSSGRSRNIKAVRFPLGTRRFDPAQDKVRT